ncbi:roadblock/LC7 domain-containing protein [Streptomyces sp. CA2R106]|uniref:roadblock/LC7 domain-containing protein n=1 Tax=Streptomyces sp. CA2R106 TaxID=3120153 RepID=UPI003008EBEB
MTAATPAGGQLPEAPDAWQRIMAHEADVRDELGRLLSRLPDATGAVAATADGLLIAHEAPDAPAEALAALSSAGFGIGLRLAGTGGDDSFHELVVRAEHGCVALYPAGPSCVLAVLAGPHPDLQRLHTAARATAARVADLLAAAGTDLEV